MIEHLKKWMYINSVDNDELIKIWKIISNNNKKPVILSSKAYILSHFYDFLNWKISLEDFYMIWDYYSNIDTKLDTFIKNPYDFFDYIKNEKISEDKIYLVDKLFKWILDREDIFYI